MSDLSAPNAAASTEDFEFEALREANNYRAALMREFHSQLKGSVIEVGAGIGQMTAHLRDMPQIQRILSIEPDAGFCAKHRAQFPEHELIEGSIGDVPPGSGWDAILSINVLEHIEHDEPELAAYSALLRERHGAFCILVPARPEIYAPIDGDFGHFRRYTKPELRRKLENAGFKIERLCYFNFVGYFAWWANFCLLKKRGFEREKVRFFDRAIFPVVNFTETHFLRPPIGQSLVAIARA